MAKELPALSEAVFSQVQKVAQLEKVQKHFKSPSVMFSEQWMNR